MRQNPFAEEAEERWGGTAAYQQSVSRTAEYTEADWEQLDAEAAAIDASMVALMRDGVPADSEEAMGLAEQHRLHIGKWFYECPKSMHADLGQMYVTDSRFTDNIDKAGAGLASYLAQAIAANAAS